VATPYSVLEVPANANADTIKAAFRAKAKSLTKKILSP
jgi:curved DNA-binding protein CbpA